jgi:hypothetical protein
VPLSTRRIFAVASVALLAGLAAPLTASADLRFDPSLDATLTSPGVAGQQPELAGNAAGVASAIYLEKVGAVYHAFVRVKAAGTTSFGAAHELSTVSTDHVATAVAADGTVSATWQEGSACVGSKIFIATAPPGGAFGSPVKVADNAYNPELAVAPDGTVFALYTHEVGLCAHEVHVQVRPRQGSPVDSTISDPNFGSTDAGVASIGVDGAGTAIAAFTQSQTKSPFAHILRVARRPAGGAWSTATFAGPTTNGARLGVSPDGHGVVAYSGAGASGHTVEVRSVIPDPIILGGSQTVTNASVNHVLSGLAVADGGVAVVTTTAGGVARRAAGAAKFGTAADLGLSQVAGLVPALTAGGDLALFDIEKLPGADRFSLVARVEPKGGSLSGPLPTGLDSDSTGQPNVVAFGANDVVAGWNPRAAGAKEFVSALALGDGRPPAPASPPAPAGGAIAAATPPAAKLAVRIAKPRRGTRARRLHSLRGTASGPVSRVEVSIVRLRKHHTARTAKPRKFTRAKGARRWALKLRRTLPRGTYVVFARARSATGARSKLARVTFRLA